MLRFGMWFPLGIKSNPLPTILKHLAVSLKGGTTKLSLKLKVDNISKLNTEDSSNFFYGHTVSCKTFLYTDFRTCANFVRFPLVCYSKIDCKYTVFLSLSNSGFHTFTDL